MKRVIDGLAPADVFREVLASNPTLSNHDLAWMFVQEFPKVAATANNFIWYWKSPARPGGHFDDALVNSELMRLLDAAGY